MADIKKSFREGVVVALSCQANVSDGTANQLTYNWRKDGEVFATDSGAGGTSIITTTESGTYDVLISHSEGDPVVTNTIEVSFIPGRNLLRVIELPFGSVSPNKRIQQYIKERSIDNPPTWVKSETIDAATKGQIFALPSNAKRYDINLEDTFYEVGPPTAGMVFMYAKENDITVEVTLEGSPGEPNYPGRPRPGGKARKLGGRGGVGTIKYTMQRGVVHSFKMGYPGRGAQGGPNFNSGGGGGGEPNAGDGGGPTIFYRGGRVIAVSGGGGGAGVDATGGAGGGPGSSGAKGGGKGGGKGGVKPKALHPSFPNKEWQKKGFKSKYSAIGNARGRKGGQLPKGSVIKGKIDFSKYSEYEGANNGGGGRGRQKFKHNRQWRGAGGGGTGAVGGDGGAKGGAGGGGGAGWYDTSSATLVKTRQGGSLANFGRARIRFVEFSDDTADSICIAVCDESKKSAISGSGQSEALWSDFRKCWPNRTFHLFQPKGNKRKKSDMFIPDNFEDDDKAFYHEVTRDNGKSSALTDWFEIANVQCLDGNTTLVFSIDTSGSMRRSTVAASIDLFLQKCSAAGINVVERKMTREDWISPFIDYPYKCKKKNDDIGDDKNKSIVEPRGQVVFEGPSKGKKVTQWKVPTGVRQISAVCVGGGGNGEPDGGWAGSGGGLSYGTMKVTPGEILRITAGGPSERSMIERRKDKKFKTSSILLVGNGGESGPGSKPSNGPKPGTSGGVERDGGGTGGKGGNKRGSNDGGGGGGAAGYSGNGGMGEGLEYESQAGSGRQEAGKGGGGGGGGVLGTIGRGGGGVGLKGEGTSGAGQTKGNDSTDSKYENDGQGGSGGSDGTTTSGGEYGGGGPVSNKNFQGSKGKPGGVGAVRIIWGLDGKTSKYRIYPKRGTEDQSSIKG